MQQKKYGLSKKLPQVNPIHFFQKNRHHYRVSPALMTWLVLLVSTTVKGNETNLAPVPQLSEEKTAKVFVAYRTSDNATTYSISSGNCKIAWIARDSERGVIKHAADCALPLAEQIRFLEEICGAFLSRDENAHAFRTLFWGTLDPDAHKGSREMSLRLALAAHASPDWDAETGRPKKGSINGFVEDLANKEMIYPELKDLFDRFHRSIKFSCAEKVLVQRAEKLPFYEQMKRQGVKAGEKVPYDCMTWFSVSEK